jgi:hypothetical protein
MSVAKVIEISATSPDSFEAAINNGIERAKQTISDIQGVWIKEQHVDLEDNQIARYRVDMKVTFVLHDEAEMG